MSQTEKEKEVLFAGWLAHHLVDELNEQVKAFACREKLAFDAEGMNRALAFANVWIAEHGPLPDSGIKCL